jgi:hypothetical protein
MSFCHSASLYFSFFLFFFIASAFIFLWRNLCPSCYLRQTISIFCTLTVFLLRQFAFRNRGKRTSCSTFPYRDSQRVKIFLFSTASRPTLGPTQSPIQWVPKARSPGVMWPGREADHSHPSSSEAKNGGAIPLQRQLYLLYRPIYLFRGTR